MRSRSARGASRVLAAIVAATCSFAAQADSLFNDSEARHGKIVGIDAKGITFVQGCGAGVARTPRLETD